MSIKNIRLSEGEIAALASIIVRDAHCEPKYSADSVALALIRLVDGVAIGDENERGEIVFMVAVGCFHRTHTHGEAIENFINDAMKFDFRRLRDEEKPSVTEWWKEDAR